MSKFSGKKAIVLGGTSGIGLSTCRMLRDAGAEVIAVSRRGTIDDSDSTGITLESCDVLDREALSDLFARHGQYDYLVCTATGGPRARGPFLEMDSMVFRVHLPSCGVIPMPSDLAQRRWLKTAL